MVSYKHKKSGLGFLSTEGGALRPADILFHNWDNGRDVFLDVTGISPFTRVNSFIPWKAVSNVVSRKRNKYLDKLYYTWLLFRYSSFDDAR